LSVRLIAWMTFPSIWFLRPFGLTISPQSCATQTRVTRTLCADSSDVHIHGRRDVRLGSSY
jgi:hypothetical protein